MSYSLKYKNEIIDDRICKKESKMEMEQKRKDAAIPKSSMDDFNQLTKLGFEINGSVSAINSSCYFGSALDF